MNGSLTKAIIYALSANFAIFVAKAVAAFITKSGSMVAEAIHSFADCGNQLLLLLGMKRSTLPANKSHPLGYGKVIYFWSFIVAVMLFSLGGLFSIWEGIHKLTTPEPIHQAWIALSVIGISVIIELSSLLGALKEIKHIRGKRTFFDWVKNTRSSELIVVLGEDIAAVIGLVLAFIFVGLATIFNNPIYDAMGSISIGVILLIVSCFLLVRMKSLLIGKSAEPELHDAIENIIKSHKEIEKVFNVITIQVGPYIMLAAKINIKDGVKIEQACEIINDLEKELKNNIPEIKWSFIEPDVED